MKTNYFVNSFIDSGIKNYLLLEDGLLYEREHTFEIYVIKALCKIYGEINVINPYKICSENSFKCNLLMYGLSEKGMELFFSYCNQYEEWLNSEKSGKTDLTTKIEKMLIDMIVMKFRKHVVDEKTLEYFNVFFNPVDNGLAKIHSLITLDKDFIPNYWKRKKSGFNNKIKLVNIRTDLLSRDDYAIYDIDITDVENLTHEQVSLLNNKIKEKEKKSKQTLFKPKKILMTSGSGFVDTIMLLSIMATEVMIGLILAFYFLRG